MRLWRLSSSLTLVVLAGVAFLFSLGDCGQHGSSLETAKLKPCRLPGIDEALLCGKLTVFENRQRRSGRTIDLNVIVLRALEPNEKEEPLFDLAGGPGAASTEGAPFYAGPGKEYRRHRDVVLVDQRGTGKSNGLKLRRPGKRRRISSRRCIRWIT